MNSSGPLLTWTYPTIRHQAHSNFMSICLLILLLYNILSKSFLYHPELQSLCILKFLHISRVFEKPFYFYFMEQYIKGNEQPFTNCLIFAFFVSQKRPFAKQSIFKASLFFLPTFMQFTTSIFLTSDLLTL
jgi:hypothetical protein